MTEQWFSMHIHYASRPEALLVDCIQPLVRTLREHGLIRRYFFLRYWQEGPHVRLRLLPEPGAGDEVRSVAEREIKAFLRRRPALFEPDGATLRPVYQRLFLAEYGEERWNATYGVDGTMPIRSTNTVYQADYEPEYHRYGGRDGVELAEWHFEHSSDSVLDLMATANLHVRPVLLGQSAQLSAAACFALLDDDAAIVEFFTKNRAFWERSYGPDPVAAQPNFEKAYAGSGTRLRDRIAVIGTAVRRRDLAVLPPLQRDWVEHAYQLRDRLADLAESADRLPVPVLLASYLHMNNNRLGVTIQDEVYLSYMMARAVSESALDSAG